MATQDTTPHTPELLEGEVLPAEQTARLCCVSTKWLHDRLEQEVIYASHKDGHFYFSATMLTRIKDVAHIERTYDADPQLAALVADLMQEIRVLKNQR